MAKYYVCTKGNWQFEDWTATDGPFDNRRAAQDAAQKYQYNPSTEWGGIDIKEQIHAKVFTRSELLHMGYPNSDRGEYDLLESIHSEQTDPSRPWNETQAYIDAQTGPRP